ncbi:hypothetical protein NQ314_014698 [Rhamnusium bicolor]|uniref:Scavenger receptor class B member 1 n=1 Tax=Rhamnusium bicolor TaxID=1586634 RepID=A0AAV8X167_9CUCU|nr:hypothetical protein NQ314_014698 [Rhamnusium bicolor]
MMWFTDLFDNAILSNLVISNTSEFFEMWKSPAIKASISFYIFNYTNLEEFEARMVKKLHVQEVGPYVYDELLERVNISFQDDTVSYQEKRTYAFRPDLSKGRQSDRVMVPNIPLMSGAAMTKHRNYFTRLGFSSILNGLDEKPFVKLPADSFILGYDDDLFDISRSLAKLEDKPTPEKFGLLATKSGLQPNVLTMNTGRNDINKLGIIEKLNGKKQLEYWSTEECNRLLSSSDGVVHPPKLVQQKQPLSFLMPNMCRSLPLVFDREVKVLNGKIPSYSTAKRDVQTYMNLHPVMGFSMSGKMDIQVNLQVQKAYGMYQLDRYEDGLMLPIAWIKYELNDKTLPQSFIDVIYGATYTFKGVKMALKYGCLLTSLITLVCIILVFKNKWESATRVNSTSSRQRLQRQHTGNTFVEL